MFAFQLTLGCLNCLMIYKLSLRMYSREGADKLVGKHNFEVEKVAFRAAMLYNVSQTMVYQVSSYSEVLFTFLQLLSAFIIHPQPSASEKGGHGVPSLARIALGSLPLVLGTFTRSTGILGTCLPLYFLAHKTIQQITQATKHSNLLSRGAAMVKRAVLSILYILTALAIVILAGVAPIVYVTSWKPFQMYCLSTLQSEEDLAIPEWCFDAGMPNIYNYIQ
mmetsp:Transcript_11479/g.19423  ORF Transcript_11479/g.19423 Transcript_11479/m.19423 type:complete len:221 (+) Transcript_11479:363-1025(+)